MDKVAASERVGVGTNIEFLRNQICPPSLVVALSHESACVHVRAPVVLCVRQHRCVYAVNFEEQVPCACVTCVATQYNLCDDLCTQGQEVKDE